MSDATVVHAEIARLSKNRVFEPYPEATHLVRLDDAEDAVRRAFAAGRAAATPTPSDEEGWSPGIDDPEPPALGDIDTGEGWYQT